MCFYFNLIFLLHKVLNLGLNNICGFLNLLSLDYLRVIGFKCFKKNIQIQFIL